MIQNGASNEEHGIETCMRTAKCGPLVSTIKCMYETRALPITTEVDKTPRSPVPASQNESLQFVYATAPPLRQEMLKKWNGAKNREETKLGRREVSPALPWL